MDRDDETVNEGEDERMMGIATLLKDEDSQVNSVI